MTSKTTFPDALVQLRDTQKPFTRTQLRLYSDLDPASLQLFVAAWQKVPPARQLAFLDKLIENYEEDTLVSYEDLARSLLKDPRGEVRARAIRLLTETEDPALVGSLLEIYLNDPEYTPRFEALHVLGALILLGEYGRIEPASEQKIQQALISVIRSDDTAELRRASLETLAFSSHPEVPALIESASERLDPAWIASALRAMGHSQDERWHDEVLEKLLDDDQLIRNAAIEAAGALAIQEAVPVLIQFIDDQEQDEEILISAIWSLSQIGGDDARAYLLSLADQTEDEELLDFLDSAIDNLDLSDELANFDLLSLEDDEPDEEDDRA